MGVLLDEWRDAVDSESRNSTRSKLILTMALRYVPDDYGIRKWLSRGFPSEKLVLGLPFHDYAWTLLELVRRLQDWPLQKTVR
ncbi:1,4-alpha-glucan-branching enzyme [Trema orientale]|uniref:1,4-alpha-glucan-branching enzyme n=1 Tax=Trema orientale TaxID=63057 RepID=A0A2P5ESL8_TREOI|nr:1,4-alpha-glucan-branching enzyme [Trema orientale]